MKLIHIDLFSGIGGFSLALDNVYGKENVEHIFCDNEPFAQEVLKKHWPNSPIYGDIRSLTADSYRQGLQGSKEARYIGTSRKETEQRLGEHPFLLTGGFPCQPFSQAGRRRGEEDDRFLWPEMLRIIREFSPLWVIAENVRGLLTQSGGVVFERICTDLESAGYEVQPIIIPAVAVGAPHKRDRVWFIAHASSSEHRGRRGPAGQENSLPSIYRQKIRSGRIGGTDKDAANAEYKSTRNSQQSGINKRASARATRPNPWPEHWLEVATRLCRVDDGVRTWVDGRGKIRNSRNNRLKALGNAIVPAVAEQIMLAIKDTCGTMDTI